MKFDVHHAGAIGGVPIGAFLTTIEASGHGPAKDAAAELHPGLRLVVLPHRPSTEKLERAIRRLDRQRARRLAGHNPHARSRR